MTIEINGHELRTPTIGAGFDLYLLKDVNIVEKKVKTGKFKKELVLSGYNMPFDYAIKVIADNDIAAKHECLNVREYMLNVDEKIKEITNTINNLKK